MSGTRNLDGLRAQALHCIEDAYIKGYEAAREDIIATGNKSEYERGLNDAWECVKKIATDKGLNYEELVEIFGYTSMDAIFGRFSASEAIAKIKEYEEKKAERNASPDNEIHVGDEICLNNSARKYIVTAFLDNGKLFVLEDDGFTVLFDCNEIHKTGRKYPIMEILRKLNELNESEE